jgi:hypothetical protein
MIIFGTRTMNSNAGAGLFNCPRCGPQRQFTHRKANRWFTLYFIPVIPLGTAGEYIECSQCAGTYGMEVLQYDPAAERAEIYATVRRLVVLAMLHAGKYEPETVAALRSALQDLTGEFVSDEQIHQDAQFAQQAGAQLEPVFHGQTADFSADGKTLVLILTLKTLAPDGSVDAAVHQILHRAGAAMQMPTDVIEQMIATHASPS